MGFNIRKWDEWTGWAAITALGVLFTAVATVLSVIADVTPMGFLDWLLNTKSPAWLIELILILAAIWAFKIDRSYTGKIVKANNRIHSLRSRISSFFGSVGPGQVDHEQIVIKYDMHSDIAKELRKIGKDFALEVKVAQERRNDEA